jgi:hypothetical protein
MVVRILYERQESSICCAYMALSREIQNASDRNVSRLDTLRVHDTSELRTLGMKLRVLAAIEQNLQGSGL